MALLETSDRSRPTTESKASRMRSCPNVERAAARSPSLWGPRSPEWGGSGLHPRRSILAPLDSSGLRRRRCG
jgi:hypothetical protein